MRGCKFCAIAEGKEEASVVYEDELTLAFMDINPLVPGHTLVVPKRHFPDIFSLKEPWGSACFLAAGRVARAVRAAFGAEGLDLLQLNGRVGGQSVFHFHIHVVPRYPGDGFGFFSRRRPVTREELERHAARIREAMEEVL
ncbi:MAG: HIT family protein [Candidatus Latescibacterota bacterium]|nr:MAG: HIT family protein [Candidatus Latescibacterota bacterium]RKY65607.1 MAG: HIT family protein [Candidatus Latescibacterota bacterium]RKY73739.1 MAG: HIT family protein [Candidatus Latescibacterota bacterium]